MDTAEVPTLRISVAQDAPDSSRLASSRFCPPPAFQRFNEDSTLRKTKASVWVEEVLSRDS